MSQKTVDTNELTSVKRKLVLHDHSINLILKIQRLNVLTAESILKKHVKVECRDIKNMTELAKRGMYDRTQLL